MKDFFAVTPSILLLGISIVAFTIGLTLWREHRERALVELALFPEVVALRRQAAALAAEIARRHEAREPFDTRFFALWHLSAPMIYPATGAAGLRCLSRESLGRVGHFHAQLADARARLARAQTKSGFEPSPYRMLSTLIWAVNNVEPWLHARRLRLGLGPQEDEDLSFACSLLASFESTAEEPLAVPYCWVDCAEDRDDSDLHGAR